MTFDNIVILMGKTLDRNEMKDDTLYLFQSNGAKVAAWLDDGQIKLKQVTGK